MDQQVSELAYRRLMERRTIILDARIDDEVSSVTIAQLLYIAGEGGDPIQLLVNAPGGSVSASLAIVDTIDSIEAEVSTICNGQAGGTAAMIVAAGARGRRIAMPHARFHLTPFLPDREYRPEELEEFIRMRRETYERFAQLLGRSADEVEADCERRKILSAEEAREYGIIDEIRAEGNG